MHLIYAGVYYAGNISVNVLAARGANDICQIEMDYKPVQTTPQTFSIAFSFPFRQWILLVPLPPFVSKQVLTCIVYDSKLAYGRINPLDIFTNAISCIQSYMGIFMTAVLAGTRYPNR